MRDDEILEGLIRGGKNRRLALMKIFEHSAIRMNVRNALRSYEICRQDWEIILIESIEKLVEKIFLGEFEGTSFNSIKGFLTTASVNNCRNLKRKKTGVPRDYQQIELYQSHEETVLIEEKHRLLRSALEKIGKNCKELLLLFYNDYSYEEIARKLEMASSDVVKTSKYRCMNQLKKYITDHPELSEHLKF